MEEQQNIFSKLKAWLTGFFAKLAIRSKWIKEASYSPEELNEMLATSFPQTLPVPMINSEGTLTLLNAELSMPLEQDTLHIQLFCAFKISVAGHDIYRAHLTVCGTVLPYYAVTEKVIRIKNMTLTELRLINDDYAFIGSSTELATLFMPKAFKYLLLSSMQLTLSVLKGAVPNSLLNYLNLYASGSKQKVLDYHHSDIEHLIIKKVEQEDWFYPLDESDFEEQLFAQFGQTIAVENGRLLFKFHLD
ncbi:MAG: hypothetical protein QF552_07730 [Litorilituus sp.]|jgi:hypothetical protein|nr:hypothetical protein [Litorilituus sp.]